MPDSDTNFADIINSGNFSIPVNNGLKLLDIISSGLRTQGLIRDDQGLIWGTDVEGINRLLIGDITSSPPTIQKINIPTQVNLPQPATVATWGDYEDLMTYTATHAGIHQFVAQVDAHVSEPANRGGDRAYVEYQLTRMRGADETIIVEGESYIRNIANNNEATADIISELDAFDEAAVGDIYTLKARWQTQEVHAGRELQFITDKNFVWVFRPTGVVETNYNIVSQGTTLPSSTGVGRVFLLTRDEGDNKRGLYVAYEENVWTRYPVDIASWAHSSNTDVIPKWKTGNGFLITRTGAGSTNANGSIVVRRGDKQLAILASQDNFGNNIAPFDDATNFIGNTLKINDYEATITDANVVVELSGKTFTTLDVNIDLLGISTGTEYNITIEFPNFTGNLKNKLDGIEDGAEQNEQADWRTTDSNDDSFIKNKPTIPAAETSQTIKTKYESNANTNAFTNDEKTKLANIDPNASDDLTDAEIKTKYENNPDTNAFTDADKAKLATADSNATDEETPAEIKTKYESNLDTNAFTDNEKAKVGRINVSSINSLTVNADKTITISYNDGSGTATSRVSGAIPFFDLEQIQDAVSNMINVGGNLHKQYNDAAGTLTLTATDRNLFRGMWVSGTAYIAGDIVIDNAKVFIALNNVSGSTRPTTDTTNWLELTVEAGITAVQHDTTLTGDGTSANTLKVANPYTSAEKTKLAGIAENADVSEQSDWGETDSNAKSFIRQKPTIPAAETAATIKTKYESNADTNAFTNADKSKVDSSITAADTDNTLTGDGTPARPLKVARPFTTDDEAKIAEANAEPTAEADTSQDLELEGWQEITSSPPNLTFVYDGRGGLNEFSATFDIPIGKIADDTKRRFSINYNKQNSNQNADRGRITIESPSGLTKAQLFGGNFNRIQVRLSNLAGTNDELDAYMEDDPNVRSGFVAFRSTDAERYTTFTEGLNPNSIGGTGNFTATLQITAEYTSDNGDTYSVDVFDNTPRKDRVLLDKDKVVDVIPEATGTAKGAMSPSDKTKLDLYPNTPATIPSPTPLSDDTPNKSTGTGSAGTGAEASREDHIHPAPDPTPIPPVFTPNEVSTLDDDTNVNQLVSLTRAHNRAGIDFELDPVAGTEFGGKVTMLGSHAYTNISGEAMIGTRHTEFSSQEQSTDVGRIGYVGTIGRIGVLDGQLQDIRRWRYKTSRDGNFIVRYALLIQNNGNTRFFDDDELYDYYQLHISTTSRDAGTSPQPLPTRIYELQWSTSDTNNIWEPTSVFPVGIYRSGGNGLWFETDNFDKNLTSEEQAAARNRIGAGTGSGQAQSDADINALADNRIDAKVTPNALIENLDNNTALPKFRFMTEADYQALTNRDDNTYYFRPE